VVAGAHVVERLWRKLGAVLAHPVQRRVRESDLAQAFLLQVLVDQRHGPGPQRGRGRGAAYLAVAAAEDDVEASRGIAVSGDVRHLAIAATGRHGLVLLVGRNRVELACTSTAAALVERAAPCVFLEVDALLGFEDAGATDRGDRRQGGGKTARGILVDAARVRPVVSACDEVRYAHGNGAIFDRRVDVAGAARRVRLARAQALRDDRSGAVGHKLVEGPVAMAEVRCGEVDDQLGLGRHRVDDLEVEHGFALGLLRRAQLGSRFTVSTDANAGRPYLVANFSRSLKFGRSSISGSMIVCPVPSRPASRSDLML